MIRFQCPRCQSILEAPEKRAGTKTSCPKCQQRLQIPLPPPNQTVLAPLVAHVPTALQPGQPPQSAPAIPPAAIHATPATPPRPSPWKRFSFFAGAAVLLSLFVLLLVVLIRVAFPEAGAVAEKRGHTRIGEEELVKRYILNNAKDPKAVRFTRWGPHLRQEEVEALLEEAGVLDLLKADAQWRQLQHLGRLSFVRVCYSDPSTPASFFDDPLTAPPQGVRDQIYIVAGKLVAGGYPNREGDGWKVAARKNLAKMFPGINP